MVKIMVIVAMGGALGALLRYGFGQLISFPFATLGVNIVGSFLIGVFYVLLGARLEGTLAAFIIVGLLGGLTTFSAFSLDVVRLVQDARLLFAVFYVNLSVLGALLACFFGVFVARALL